MRVLITRPEEDAAPLAAALRARGHKPSQEPLLHIEPAAGVRAPLDLDGVQAVLFTSANGVRAFARLSQERGLPVFAVGDASARAAREAGFAEVASAAGDVEDLARLVSARLKPEDGALYHGAGRRLAGDLKARLDSAGFTLRRAVLYEAHAASELSSATRTALSTGAIDAVAFFSPRTAQTFGELIQQADLAVACASLDAVCLSAAVAEKLRVLPWRNVRIAAQPDQDALLDCVDSLAGRNEATVVERAMSTQDDSSQDKVGAEDSGGAPGAESAAHEIIAKFGGIRPMANKLGVAVSTVQGWRERASIPAARHGQIQAAADTHKIDIDAEVLAASDHAPEGHAPEGHAPGGHGEDKGHGEAEGVPAASSRWIPESGRTQESETAPLSAEPAETTETIAPNRTARGGSWTGAFLIAAVIFTVAAGGTVLTREAWMPYLAPTPTETTPAEDPNAARIEALERRLADLTAKVSQAPGEDPNTARIEALEGRLSDLASQPSGAAGEANLNEARAEIAKLRRDLDDLASRLESVGEIARAGGDSEQLGAALARIDAGKAETDRSLAALQAQIASLAETPARAPAPAGGAAMTLAVLQMRDALRGAEPFATALNTLDSLAADSTSADAAVLREAIAPLRPYATAGAPSLESLQAAFPAVARAVIAKSRGGQGEGFLANALRRLSGLVSVRPHGPVEGDSVEAVVARAEAHLEAGDLTSALRELDSLSGPASDAAAGWRAEAEARLTVQAALARLGGLLAAGRVAGRD